MTVVGVAVFPPLDLSLLEIVVAVEVEDAVLAAVESSLLGLSLLRLGIVLVFDVDVGSS